MEDQPYASEISDVTYRVHYFTSSMGSAGLLTVLPDVRVVRIGTNGRIGLDSTPLSIDLFLIGLACR